MSQNVSIHTYLKMSDNIWFYVYTIKSPDLLTVLTKLKFMFVTLSLGRFINLHAREIRTYIQ